MKKFFLFLLIFSGMALFAADEIFFEAEDFKGNGTVKAENGASGGRIVTGSNWYVFAKDIPIPAGSSFCYARVRSAHKANWFLAYDMKKPFGWFQTPGENKWVWVRLGKFSKSDKNKGLMPQICLQKPIGADKTNAAVDVVVFAPNAAEAEKIFAERNSDKTGNSNSFYLEAEDFNGNGYINNDASCGSGKIVTGKTWYEMVKNIPIPDSSRQLYCFARVRTALPAYWFLAYDTKKPFGWFQTPGENKWVWVCIGQFKKDAKNQGIMPRVFLQKPRGSSAQTTDGAIDAIVFSDTNDPAVAEELFRQSTVKKPEVSSAADNARAAELAALQRFYTVKEVSSPPKVDGNIDDAAYRDAPEAADFILLGGRKLAGEKTVVKAVWYKDSIYIAAKLYESRMPLLRRLRTKDNDSVWSDDCFEIYLDPGHTRKKAFQLVVNPNGVKQDTSLKRRIDEAGFSDLKLTWQTAVKLAKDHWTVEARIPLKLITFEEVKKGTVWGVNFCRSEIPSGEKSFWNNTGEYFFRPERYAIMHFGDAPGNPQSISLDSSKGTLTVAFAPEKKENISVSGKIAGSEKVSSESKTLASPGEITIPVAGKERKYTVLTSISNGENKSSFAVDVRNYQDGLLSTLWPCEERNNRLPILYGSAQHAFWLFANHTANAVKDIQAVITLPEGIELLDPTTDVPQGFYKRCKLAGKEKIQQNGKNFTRYTIDIEGALGPVNIQKLHFYNGITIYLKCTDPALIGKKMPVTTMIKSGKLLEEDNLTTIEILPPAKGIQPEKLVIHNWLWTWCPYTGCLDECLNTMKLVGFNSIEADNAQFLPGRREAFAKYDLSLVNNLFWEFHGKKTDLVSQAVNFDGSVNKNLVCPTAMLKNNGAGLLENRAKLLEDIKGGSQGVVWDLEGPYCWKICFCKDCIADFVKFAGLDSADGLTPKVIREKYNSQWIKYCCNQTAEMSRIIRDEFRKINPAAKFGFYSGLPSFDTMESYRADWENAAKYIDLALLSYYTNSYSSLDDSFNAGMKKHIANLKKINPELQVWATLTPGYTRNSSMVPPPELIKLKVLRSFASGADGVSFWWWGPFDGDYYAQLAQAAEIIGRYEKFFLAGEKPVSLKVACRKKGRFSVFTSTIGSEEFILLLNHGGTALEFEAVNPEKRQFTDAAAEKEYNKDKFTVTLPPYGAKALYSAK